MQGGFSAESLIDEYNGSAARHLAKKLGDIVRVGAYAAMGLKSIDACRRNRAMYAIARDTKPQPMTSQRIVRTRRNTSLYRLALPLHLILNRLRHIPCRIFLSGNDGELAGGRRPVPTSQPHRKETKQSAFVKMKKQTLGNIDEDTLFDAFGYDVAIIDAQHLFEF